MSLIQDIREKYAKWAVVAIALSLVGFIMMDAFSSRSNLFSGGNSTTVGVVNGKKIDYFDFETKVKTQEQQAAAQGQNLGESGRERIIENVWNQEVNQAVMGAEFRKLGFNIGEKELNDLLYGNNPPQDLKQRFTNEQGQYDAAQAQNFLNQLKRSPQQEDRAQLAAYIKSLEQIRMMDKYTSLLNNSIYYPKWFVEKQNSDNSGLAKISYVFYPYTKMADSAVTISDKEIQEYISKNKTKFKQEESRSIAYVVFDASPTSADTAALVNQMTSLKEEFAAEEDPASFLARYGSAMEFFDAYNVGSKIQVPEKDNILALEKNAVYGPYQDGASFVMAKMIDSKVLPDSARARHILIKTTDPQQGIQLLDDSTAKRRIDSIALAIRNGASFEALALQYSEDNQGPDGGSAAKGGDLGWFGMGIMVKEFNDFCFEGKKGDRDVVKTIFGYHLIEVTDQKNFEKAYKIAYFSKAINPSDETDRKANNDANRFAGDSRSLEAFDANVEKTLKPAGINKLVATDIKPNDYTIDGINAFGSSRQMVRDIYKAKKGEVLQPHRVGDKYIVAVVTDVFDEGTMSVASARPVAEPALKNKKKAEAIKKIIGNVTTLEAASAATGEPINTVDSLRITGAAAFYDAKVIGAAFNLANKGKVINEAIAGQSGVYVVRVDDFTATPVDGANIEDQQLQLTQNAKNRAQQMAMYGQDPTAPLKKAAKIKDRRSEFY